MSVVDPARCEESLGYIEQSPRRRQLRNFAGSFFGAKYLYY